MTFTTAINDLSTTVLKSHTPGAIFHLINRRHKLGSLCLYVTNESDLRAYVELSGSSQFRVFAISDENEPTIALSENSLFVRISDEQPDTATAKQLGALVVAGAGAYLIVQLDGYDGDAGMFYLSLRDWKLREAAPTGSCSVQNWHLLSRAAGGTETVLVTGGQLI